VIRTKGKQLFNVPDTYVGGLFVDMVRKYARKGVLFSVKDRAGWKAVYVRKDSADDKLRALLAAKEEELAFVRKALANMPGGSK
jgi:hypothetical protein